MGCIYMWTNQENKKRYIGKCHGDVMTRYKEHIAGRGNQPLKNAIDKYGIENFTFEILHDGVLDEFLDNYEKEAIKKHNTVAPNGYNLTYGGDGGKKSQEARARMSEAAKGRTYSAETRAKMSATRKGRKGHPVSDEAKLKISKANQGKIPHNKGKPSPMRGVPLSAETRSKISKANTGKPSPNKGKPAWNRGLPAWNRGIPCKPETKEKISKKMQGNQNRKGKSGTPLSDETRARMSAAHTGKPRKPHTPEGKKNIARAKYSQERKDAYKIFTQLSGELGTQEIRKILQNKFPNTHKETIRVWVKKWEQTGDC